MILMIILILAIAELALRGDKSIVKGILRDAKESIS